MEKRASCHKSCGRKPSFKQAKECKYITEGEEAPAYLPQPKDKYGDVIGGENQTMGPIGPWAGGNVEWSPHSGLTGTRPVVDHYSTTRYSEGEWRKHNEEVLCSSADDLHRVNMAEFNSRRGLACIAATADKNQYLNTVRIGERTHEILRWKNEVEREIYAFIEEVKLLEQKRRQARQAGGVLELVRSISSECLERRACRDGHDLMRDTVEEELIKERALVYEVGGLIERTLKQINEQQIRNKSIKEHLEGDWSDKKEAYEIEAQNMGLRTGNITVLFKPASTRFPANQSTPLGWESATKELLMVAEAVRAQSCELRALLDGPILQDCIKDLRAQADRVDAALAKGIADTQNCIKAMEAELEVVVRRNAESEKLILDLQYGIRGLDEAMKTAQTRLDYLQRRPRCENTRDKAQFGLVDEVKNLAEQTSALKGQLAEAEEALLNLIRSRAILEKELQNKLKTLDIDRYRCQVIRSHYPSSSAMAGF
ncbi:tektin-4 [Cimex lectularius]|uniref:Tektin n=1 Tax=Cimex lectularius TaxID=79782 RepID=A0A8I6THV1_CIMLE|nr:tektin-4 [Cimex lectularius]